MIKYLTFNLLQLFIVVFYLVSSCKAQIPNKTESSDPFVIVLGTIQDAGSPHIGCSKSCCINLIKRSDPSRKVVSLGIVDPINKKTWVIEATPDMPAQLKILKANTSFMERDVPDGIFLTHAHIGHYTGLMYFGREAMGAKNVPVYAMPRMKKFLIENGPWSQLVELKNIELKNLTAGQIVRLSSNISITPFIVPHRDEFSETVGYRIDGPGKSLLFIPDIDKWIKWDKNIVEEINNIDFALIDATFYDNTELPGRDMTEIPHPFVVESMELFNEQPVEFRKKIHFIHLNHTNPMLDSSSVPFKLVQKAGYNVASMSQILRL